MQYENKFEIIEGIHSLNILGGNSFENVQKPSQINHLSINAACVRHQLKRIKKNLKVQVWLVIFKKNGK